MIACAKNALHVFERIWGRIPYRWRYSRAFHCASRAWRAGAAAALAGAAPARPTLWGGSSLVGEEMAKKCGEAIDSHCAAVPAPRALFGAFSAFFATRRKKAESHPQRACAVSERLGDPKARQRAIAR